MNRYRHSPFMRLGARLAAGALLLGALSAAASAATDYLSVIVEAPWWTEYEVQVFYVGASQPICTVNLMGGGEINISMLNKPFFIRVYGYNTNRTDQSKTLTFINAAKPGIACVYPGYSYLAPALTNIASN